eukprot:s2053_g9.t1
MEVERSKDGVPIWNGEASTFQSYEELALQWEQGVPWHKRYLCGPRLVSELTGVAKRYILGKRPDWVSFPGGVEYLMRHLRQALGRPQISDMTDHLSKYFKATKRRKLETMNEYITRKTEAYGRAKQAYGRVADEHHGGYRPGYAGSRSTASRNWWEWGSQPSGQGTNREDEENSENRNGAGDDEQWYDALHEEDEPQGDSWWGSHYSSYGRPSWPSYEEAAWAVETEELLPNFVQGWYLLQDATLGANEKNVVMTALQGNFSLTKVAQELRNQWPEEEVRRYDQGQKQHGMWYDDDVADDGNDEVYENYYNHDDLKASGMNSEGLAMMGDAEEDAERAYNLINQGKRTLKEARFRQHQIKMSRQYYKTSYGKGRSYEKGGGKGKSAHMTCLRCGGGHKTSECPDKQGPKPAAHLSEEAPFVCFAETNGEKAYYQGEDSGEELLSTSEAIQKGFGILDGGATKTLGSVYALERLMELNQAKHGHDGIQGVDPQNTPTFGFGNSSRDTCLSTAQLSISAGNKPGVLQVHTLDKGTGPILVSIATLRQLGAVIDFEANLAVFRNLDAKKVVPLRQSASRHQMVSLTDDLFQNAKECQQAIPSLSDYI